MSPQISAPKDVNTLRRRSDFRRLDENVSGIFAVGVFAGFSKVSSRQYSLTTLGMRSVVSYCPSMLIFPTNWTYTLILCVCTMFHKKGDTQAVTEIDHGFSHRVIIRLIITPWLQRFRIPFFASVVVGGFGPGTRRLTTSSMFIVYCLQKFPLCVPVTHYERKASWYILPSLLLFLFTG